MILERKRHVCGEDVLGLDSRRNTLLGNGILQTKNYVAYEFSNSVVGTAVKPSSEVSKLKNYVVWVLPN